MTRVHLMSDKTFASRRCIMVRLGEGPYVDECTRTVAFNGPSDPGYPGPVYMAGDCVETRIESPERFGDTFNVQWVRNFYGDTNA